MKGRSYPQLNLSFAKEDKARLAKIAARYYLRPTELAALVLLEWIAAQEARPAEPISFLSSPTVLVDHPEPLSTAKAPPEKKRVRHA